MNPFAGFQRGGRGGAHEISPDEIFNMFFQGAQGGHGFRAQSGRAGGRQQPQQAAGGGGIFQQLMQFLPIILLVLMSFSSLGGNQQQQIYSLRQEGSYNIPRKTSTYGISPDIPFYVGNSFVTSYPSYSNNYKQVERSVEMDYREQLSIRCGSEREFKNRRLYQARFSTSQSREDAEKLGTPACDEFIKRFQSTNNRHRQ